MPLQGTIQPDHIPVNKYRLSVAGLIPLLFTEISGFPDDTDVVELPDRTKASGGNAKPFEFTAKMPAHHTAEIAAMEVWLAEGRDPITPTYKKPVTFAMFSGSGAIVRQFILLGTWVVGVKTPDLAMENEGEMAVYEWKFSVDARIPI